MLFPKCLTPPVVLLLLKSVFEEIESRQNRQFGGGVAQNNLFQAKSTGFPRAGRVWISPSASLPHPTAFPARFLPLLLHRAPIRLQSAATDALPHTALGRQGPPESTPRFALRGTPYLPPHTQPASGRTASTDAPVCPPLPPSTSQPEPCTQQELTSCLGSGQINVSVSLFTPALPGCS